MKEKTPLLENRDRKQAETVRLALAAMLLSIQQRAAASNRKRARRRTKCTSCRIRNTKPLGHES